MVCCGLLASCSSRSEPTRGAPQDADASAIVGWGRLEAARPVYDSLCGDAKRTEEGHDGVFVLNCIREESDDRSRTTREITVVFVAPSNASRTVRTVMLGIRRYAEDSSLRPTACDELSEMMNRFVRALRPADREIDRIEEAVLSRPTRLGMLLDDGALVEVQHYEHESSREFYDCAAMISWAPDAARLEKLRSTRFDREP